MPLGLKFSLESGRPSAPVLFDEFELFVEPLRASLLEFPGWPGVPEVDWLSVDSEWDWPLPLEALDPFS